MIAETFPVPQSNASTRRSGPSSAPTRRNELANGRRSPGKAEWTDVRDALTRAIVASATPGARPTGCSPATSRSSAPAAASTSPPARRASCTPWRRPAPAASRSTTTGCASGPWTPTAGPGLYDGLHGVAHVLDELGYRQDALDLVDRTLADDWSSRELGLHSGLAGIGLNLLHFDTEPTLRAKAVRVLDLVADRLGDGPTYRRSVAGSMRGPG